jgi:zinc D-Ala-D-Ala carboxypeptidase
MSQRISKNFVLGEFTVTSTGLTIVPTFRQALNVRKAVKKFFQPLRDAVGLPIIITSGIRTPEVNEIVGGSPNSYHLIGRGFDFNIKGLTPRQTIELIKKLGFKTVELIEYPKHVHVAI